jgi:LacI family transcriptional regulator
VISYNDLIALGLMARLSERGVAVGTDVSVVGIDDVWLAPMSNPPLTTVHVPGAALGAVAVRLLVDVIANGIDERRPPDVLASELIVRRSTSPARAGRREAA